MESFLARVHREGFMTPDQKAVIEQSLQSSFHDMEEDLTDERLFELHAQTCYCTATGRTDHAAANNRLIGFVRPSRGMDPDLARRVTRMIDTMPYDLQEIERYAVLGLFHRDPVSSLDSVTSHLRVCVEAAVRQVKGLETRQWMIKLLTGLSSDLAVLEDAIGSSGSMSCAYCKLADAVS